MTEFPGVPGTATIRELLQRDDREQIKVRMRPEAVRLHFNNWRHWDRDILVYVLAPPPRTITLPSGRTAEWQRSGVYLSVFTGAERIGLALGDFDILAAWVKEWREYEA